jgi:hypothetical protein
VGALLAKLAEVTGFELLQALPAAQTANLRRLAILRRVGGSAAHGSWEGLLEGVQDQAKFGKALVGSNPVASARSKRSRCGPDFNDPAPKHSARRSLRAFS